MKTAVTLVLDRTGSMQARKQATIDGVNEYVVQVRLHTPDAEFSMIQFDSEGIDTLHTMTPLGRVQDPLLTEENYQPRSATPLLDATAIAIERTQEWIGRKKRAPVILIATDGQENASTDWSLDKVQGLIREKEASGWTFSYIGIGPEAWSSLQTLSRGTISNQNVFTSGCSDAQTQDAFLVAAAATSSYSGCASTPFYQDRQTNV